MEKKHIALFGATGKTGREFLNLALDQGYQVTALVRDPSKLSIVDDRLQVLQGDVLSYEDVASVVSTSDVVVSLFGQVKGSPKDLQTKGTAQIIKAMKANSIDKIISLSGGGLPFPEHDQPKFADKAIRFIMKLVVPHILNDAIAHAKVLEESGLKWLIVRAPRLTLEPKKNRYRVGWVGVNASTKIGRADLVPFILKQVESEKYLSQMPFVSY